MKAIILLVTCLATQPALAATTAHHATASTHPKISEATARASAQARVPKGKVKSHELEHESGRLIYSYEFVVPGKSGVDEVNIDAMTGAVIAVTHESPKTEQHEAEKAKSQ
jgi:uncharacterized membrane protein YkoI